MGANSKIEWTDHTFNAWRGCTKVAAGCANCYADALSKRNPQTLGVWGDAGTRVRASAAMWREPRRWNEQARLSGRRARVFCASLADVFEDWSGDIHDSKGRRLWVDRATATDWQTECRGWSFTHHRPARMNDLRRDLFALIDSTPWLDWLVLTKRPENVRRMWPAKVESRESRVESQTEGYLGVIRRMGSNPVPRPLPPESFRENVWLLTSVAEQGDADRNVPALLKCRNLVPVLGLSIEPLVAPVDIALHLPYPSHPKCSQCTSSMSAIGYSEGAGLAWEGVRETVVFECDRCRHQAETLRDWYERPGVDWVIVGGESGAHARPMHPAWVRSLRDQCVAAHVPYFFKQWGEFRPMQVGDEGKPIHRFSDPAGTWCAKVGKQQAGRLLDGREWSEFPTSGASCENQLSAR